MSMKFTKSLLLHFLCMISACEGIAQDHQASFRSEEGRSQARLTRLLKEAERSRPRLEPALKGTALSKKDGPFADSSVAQMIYATHLYQASDHEPNNDLLRSLPRTAIEMEAFYEFTHSKGSEQFRPYYLAFYAAAFRLAGQRPQTLPDLFDVATQFDTKIWPNYDDVDFFCSQLGELRKNIPAQYDRAVRLRNKGDRKFLTDCGR